MAREITDRDRERGRRLRQIREAHGPTVTQEAMADLLNTAAKALGLPGGYKYYDVSRMEKGSLGFDDAAVWQRAAPKELRVTWEWFVFGPIAAKASTSRKVG